MKLLSSFERLGKYEWNMPIHLNYFGCQTKKTPIKLLSKSSLKRILLFNGIKSLRVVDFFRWSNRSRVNLVITAALGATFCKCVLYGAN